MIDILPQIRFQRQPVSRKWSLNMALKKACVLSQYIHSQVKNMTTSSETLKAMAAKHLERFLQLDVQKNHSPSGEIQNCTLKCFQGSSLMAWVVLVMIDRDINCQMQSISDTYCCIM